MRKILALASIALLSATAFAEGEMQAPKPSEEIKALAKNIVGVWKCDGKSQLEGKEMTFKNKATFTSELGGFVIAGQYEFSPKKVMARDMVGYDAGTKTFTRATYDAFGGILVSTSKGFEGGVMTWTGKGTQMGMPTEETQTTTQKSGNEVVITGTQKGPGPQNTSYELTCKK
jgi:hypothetical protein